MVTGASTADVALILVDARNGVLEQSRRHALIASLLRIPHAVVCVNKMDLVDFDEGAFDAVVRDFSSLPLHDVTFIPISALHGDNVVERSERTPWYAGPALLEWLEEPRGGRATATSRDLRFPVQLVLQAARRASWPAASSGPGDEVEVLPSGAPHPRGRGRDGRRRARRGLPAAVGDAPARGRRPSCGAAT